MNYLAKERTAAALGLSVDAMADIIRDGKTNADLAKEAKDAGENLLAEEYERLSVAEDLAAAQDKIVSSLTNMITPLLPLVDMFTSLAQSAFAVKTAMFAFATIKLGGLLMSLKAIALTLGLSAKSAIATGIGITAGLAAAIIIPAILAANSAVKNAPNPGKNDLSPMDVAQIQKGEIRAHSNESIVRTDTLEALINKAAGGGNQQQDIPPVVLSVNYSGFDAVKAPTHYNNSIA
jgi:hypothetical protein